MQTMIKVAAVQMVSTPLPEENKQTAARYIREAAEQGASLVLLPEYWAILGQHDTDKLAHAETLGNGPLQEFMSTIARECGIWLIGGTIPLVSNEEGKVRNTLLAYGPDGQLATHYDKIHLFGFSRGTEAFDESRTIVAGDDVAVLQTSQLRVGLSICYDLRFPELYRALAPTELLMVPSAFTATTGRAHWEPLLRARAIENLAWVVAPAQGGLHPNGRRTHGHSMIIDPWGEIVAELAEGEGVLLAEIDHARLQRARSSLPALQHRVL
jgi:nitrilase